MFGITRLLDKSQTNKLQVLFNGGVNPQAPVLISHLDHMYKRILVPIDGSPTSGKALIEAIKLAGLCEASMRLLHQMDPMHDVAGLAPVGGQALLSQAEAQVKASGVSVDSVLLENFMASLADGIAQQVHEWRADLIVLGTHGMRKRYLSILGGNAEAIVRKATVPVLLVSDTHAVVLKIPRKEKVAITVPAAC